MLNIGLDLLELVGSVAKHAGSEIMKVYETDFAVDEKADSSPVTEADRAAEKLIINSIRQGITDKYPIISEEAFADGTAPAINDGPFWLVDPLDGTKEFVSRNGEFTVNIALMDAGRPALGVVHAPAIKRTFWGSSVGAFSQTGDEEEKIIKCRQAPANGLVALVSRSHRTPEVDTFLADYKIASETSSGSSLKFCLIAEGAADIYPRLGRTMEWDTAAGHAVLRFAGGTVTDIDGNDLHYGKPGHENPHFVAMGPGVAKAKPSN
ncbi:MAG: 3'(2'),5'-bisphosphate nucleotidase CysQ [Rhodospirillales bacterium]|nr:3'(2'),5'-bisphosphate nucleotidase CysQ [Rhodospirillales bacterium]